MSISYKQKAINLRKDIKYLESIKLDTHTKKINIKYKNALINYTDLCSRHKLFYNDLISCYEKLFKLVSGYDKILIDKYIIRRNQRKQ